MKQLKLSIAVLIATGIAFHSCKKDEVEKEPEVIEEPIVTPVDETPAKVTSAQVEGYKSDVENAGIKLVSELDGLANSKTAETIAAMQSLSGNQLKSSAPFSLLSLRDVHSIASALKSTSGDMADEFSTMTGTYTWNASTDGWDSTGNTGKIVYKFPSTASGTVNNAELSVSEFVTVLNNQSETGDLPSKITVTLSVDGVTLSSYAFSATYNADGIPTAVSTTLNVEGYSLSLSSAYSEAEVTEGFSFLNSGTNIFSWNIKASGNFSQAKIDEISALDNINIGDYGDVLSAFETNYQILNVKLSVNANTKAIATSANSIINSGKTGSEQESDIISAINQNLDMILAYADGTLIANTEFVVVNDEPSMDFIFADDSRVSMDAYFTNSMKGVENEMNKLMEDLSDYMN